MVRGMLDSLSSTLTQPPTSLLAPIQSFEHKLDANYKSILKRSMAGMSVWPSGDVTLPNAILNTSTVYN